MRFQGVAKSFFTKQAAFEEGAKVQLRRAGWQVVLEIEGDQRTLCDLINDFFFAHLSVKGIISVELLVLLGA